MIVRGALVLLDLYMDALGAVLYGAELVADRVGLLDTDLTHD